MPFLVNVKNGNSTGLTFGRSTGSGRFLHIGQDVWFMSLASTTVL